MKGRSVIPGDMLSFYGDGLCAIWQRSKRLRTGAQLFVFWSALQRAFFLDHDSPFQLRNYRHAGDLYHVASVPGSRTGDRTKLGQYGRGAFPYFRPVYGFRGGLGKRSGGSEKGDGNGIFDYGHHDDPPGNSVQLLGDPGCISSACRCRMFLPARICGTLFHRAAQYTQCDCLSYGARGFFDRWRRYSSGNRNDGGCGVPWLGNCPDGGAYWNGFLVRSFSQDFQIINLASFRLGLTLEERSFIKKSLK